ncbi:sulfotransferase [Puniceibacterium confluentis]|uniref:sulfotransferase n=1 Tax=Puniceibacterium confluentis TaxID=1958944 RepID=UPI0011B5D45F|nr:sulfotransferase [Puniceibacterium confluentis]
MTATPIVILGMHRSGTSCLAGSLQEAGLNLGRVDLKRRTNLKGNRENAQIMELNNAVLEANGAAWDSPPAAPCLWSPEHAAQRDSLIADHPASRAWQRAWGFKDPRTLLVLEGWLEALPGARRVGTFRHPLRVARSLQERNGFDIDRGLALWMDYNRRLLRATAGDEMPLICFDWPPEQYDAALRALVAQLGLRVPAAGFSFFETALRRNVDDLGADLPAGVQAVYQELLART